MALLAERLELLALPDQIREALVGLLNANEEQEWDWPTICTKWDGDCQACCKCSKIAVINIAT